MSELLLHVPRDEQDTPGVPGLSLDYRLRWMDFDRFGALKPASILDIFQDVATLQADNQGIGHDAMWERGVFWAVIRSKFEIIKQPDHHQVVTVRTWPHTPTRFSFMRDFSMRNEDGELLVKATSEWVFMNVETRKFERMTDFYDGTMTFDEARAFPEKPRKIFDFADDETHRTIVTPSYSDMDNNGHINNAHYAEFIMDALGETDYGSLRMFQIDYRQEAMPLAPLHIASAVDTTTVLTKGLFDDGTVSFFAKFEYA